MRHDAVTGPRFEVMQRFDKDDLETLRYAIGLRRAGIIDPRTDHLLGKILQNIGRVAASQMNTEGSINASTRNDEEFDSDVALYAVKSCDKVDLCRTGVEIFKFIMDGVKMQIKERHRFYGRIKRKAVPCRFEEAMQATDFFYNTRQGAIQ